MNYAVGHNMPGYLPESDVWVVATWDEAKAILISDLEYSADQFDMSDQHDEAETLSSEAEDLNLSNGPEWQSAEVDNVVWWIMQTDEDVTDPDS